MAKNQLSELYIFRMVSGALGWAEFKDDSLVVRKKDWGVIHSSTSYHEVTDPQGEAKLVDARQMLKFAVREISDPAVTSPNDLKPVLLQKGEYFPRVWRGYVGGRPFVDTLDLMDPFNVYGDEFTGAVVAAESLLMEIKELFRSVEPDEVNDKAYGHRMRELLILLCTEVEANLVSVLKANFPAKVAKVRDSGKYLNISDYQKLKDVMYLDKYLVRLADYKGRQYSPFRNWTSRGKSSETLPWYAAYNSVKHDRETNFRLACMENVLNAAAALHILQLAQWGSGLFGLLQGARKSVFVTVEQPEIQLGEIYVPVASDTDHRRIPIGENVFDSPLPYETFIARQSITGTK